MSTTIIATDAGRASDPNSTAEEAEAPAPPLVLGASLHQYEIIRPLGRGGMGEVYLARDTRLGRLVALKLLHHHSGSGARRFLSEARLTAQVSHENIVVIHELGEHEGMPYMVLEYLEGQTLQQWMDARKERAGLPPRRVAELLIPVARALVCAHAQGVVHRDLKPSNIMLTASGATKVLDFGIAKRVGAQGPAAPGRKGEGDRLSVTDQGALLGTLPYMSPEQWGRDEVDHRADIWAMGIILAELSLGRHPLAPLSIGVLNSVAIIDLPMPSARELRPDLGKLGSIIDRCLRKRKEDRLGSARELLEELEAMAPTARRTAGDEEENPYPGLSAFRESDAGRFFGRTRAVTEVVHRLGERPLLAIVGPSGAGKSSFVRAGVIPALERTGDAWESFCVRPGQRPLAALAELILGHAWQTSTKDGDGQRGEAAALGDRDAIAEKLRVEPGLLGAQMRARARRRLSRILLFVDQLEEVYTLAPEDERAAFFACLGGAADDVGSPLRVVVAIRSDFLDRVAEAHAASTGLGRGILLLPPMDREGLREALLRPLEAVEYRFEHGALVEEMVRTLEHTAGALPLLQFTAARLWECRDRERRMLTEASYREIGGVEGTLAGHAESVLRAMSAGERRLSRAILLRLVTPERTRALATLGELRGLSSLPAEVDPVLERLVDARLLTVEGRGDDGATVEIVHESLIARWPTLSQWVRDNQEDAAFLARLRGAAREWQASGEADDALWRGRAAEEAGLWYAQHRGELGNLEDRYVRAVIELAERTRRKRRTLVLSGFAALLLVAAGMSSLAWQKSRISAVATQQAALAQREAERAQAEAERARNAMRLAVARGHEDNPMMVLALLREIEGREPPPGWSALAKRAMDAGVPRAVLDHGAVVTSVSWSPDGARVASAAIDKTVRIWNADGTGEPVLLHGHADQVWSVAFSPDGARLATASWDGTVRVWNAEGKGEPLVLAGHSRQVLSVAWSPDGKRIASTSADRTVRVWNAEGKGEPLVLQGHADMVYSASWSPDGARIATASRDKTVRVWNAGGAGDPLGSTSHDAAVYFVAFSPDGARLASASANGSVRVWRADGQDEPRVIHEHTGIAFSVAWSPDGARIVSGSADATVTISNADGKSARVVRAHAMPIYSVAFSPDGAHFATGSQDKTVRVWSAGVRSSPHVLQGHTENVTSVSWSPDGARIASGALDDTVRVFRADGDGEPLVFGGNAGKVHSTAWSPDGARVAAACEDGAVRVWDAHGKGEPRVLRADGGKVHSTAWSPDGARIAVTHSDGTVRVFRADGKGEPLVLRGHEGAVHGASWSPDGARIASASHDRSVRVFRADGKSEPTLLQGHEGPVECVAWSPDGRRIVSGSQDDTLRVWNADGKGEPLVLRGHIAAVLGVAWSPDGGRIASVSGDRTVRVWSAEGKGEPLVLEGHTGLVTGVSWSPDGTRIVSASTDDTLRIWNNLDPLAPGDPRLWAATDYCPPVPERQRLLGVSEEQAREDQARCVRRTGR
ncbi:WD40 repeat domain-containing serine/threonine protein kinase [Polyangium aurulentum]|uniref:WD40 repeat domain-containing serine/threonine protein kinase n=1 Tax=Polyangium aurulentum TaxID=2567896 RepID=UPI0010AE2993|nr:serine/threonine-protein kinase [Polyangium aurulentum]UQA55368.1 protein kinase [Polyangium aurulentum]